MNPTSDSEGTAAPAAGSGCTPAETQPRPASPALADSCAPAAIQRQDPPTATNCCGPVAIQIVRVRFGLRDRVVLVPVELVMGGAYVIGIAAALLLLGGLNSSGYSLAAIQARGIPSALTIAGVFLAAALLGPALLPWLPGRAFAVKGAALGFALVAALLVFGSPAADLFGSRLHAVAWAFLAPALTSFTVMNFTGSSTFTSLSGVLLEMRYAVPLQITAAVTGLAFWVAGLFIA